MPATYSLSQEAQAMRTHDVEEFSEIIKRHGLWQPDVKLFAEIAAKHVKQINLPMDEPDVSTKPVTASEEAKQQAKILKAGNGKEAHEGNGNGKPAEVKTESKPDLKPLKDEVAARRGRRPHAGN